MRTVTVETRVNGEDRLHRIVLKDANHDFGYESLVSRHGHVWGLRFYGQLEHEHDVAKWHNYPLCNVVRWSYVGEGQ